MDPKTQLSGLDPKLKEAYERVMGTTIPPASPAGGPAPQPPSPPTIPSNEPSIQASTLSSQQLPSEPASPPPVQAEPAPSPLQPTGFVANAPKKEKLGGLKISPPILMAVGVAFLLYIFFWIRVFNLSLF